MDPRVRRAISLALSIAVHALLLLDVYSLTVSVPPNFPEERPMPVRIIEPRPPQAKAIAKPPPVPVKPPEVAKPVEEPPAPPPPQPQPEHKLPVPEQQIVSPPDAGKNEVPPDTRLLSDRDNRVDQQSIKRGNPAPGEEAPGEKAPAKPAPVKEAKPAERPGGGQTARQPPPPRVAALPGLDRLMPDALRLAEEGYGKSSAAPGEQLAQAESSRNLQPRGSDGLFIPSAGPIGSLDYLPDVREGNITLLNTKAEVFAPFVRRVAIRVFQNFWISLRRDLMTSALAASETVQAEGLMSARGDMIGFKILQHSSRISLATDHRLQQACNDAFFDRNPPPGARAKDGNIHFIFVTEVQCNPGPRGGCYLAMSVGLV